MYPSSAEHIGWGCSGEIIPALVKVDGVAGGIGDPDELRNDFCQEMKIDTGAVVVDEECSEIHRCILITVQSFLLSQ
jgi:hypothetical protein